MKNYLGFVLGLVTGCLALLFAQLVTEQPADEGAVKPAGEQSLASKRAEGRLQSARARIAELEAELEEQAEKAVASAGGDNAGAVGGGENESGDENDTGAFLEMLMAMGDKGTNRKIDKEVDRLTELLGLSEPQRKVVSAALVQKASDEKAAGIKVLTGKASIDDLIKSDEHNFSGVDEMIEEILDADQLEEYATVQEEREIERVQAKADEEVGELAEVGDLSEEQSNAAWQILAEINASERPGDFPQGATPDEFMSYVDDAIANRVTGLTPILNGEQMENYTGQTVEFRDFVSMIIGQATGKAED